MTKNNTLAVFPKGQELVISAENSEVYMMKAMYFQLTSFTKWHVCILAFISSSTFVCFFVFLQNLMTLKLPETKFLHACVSVCDLHQGNDIHFIHLILKSV